MIVIVPRYAGSYLIGQLKSCSAHHGTRLSVERGPRPEGPCSWDGPRAQEILRHDGQPLTREEERNVRELLDRSPGSCHDPDVVVARMLDLDRDTESMSHRDFFR